jgi:hypothetical protein
LNGRKKIGLAASRNADGRTPFAYFSSYKIRNGQAYGGWVIGTALGKTPKTRNAERILSA